MPTIRLPYPPSVNHYWRTVTRPFRSAKTGKGGHRPMVLLTDAAERYRADVFAAVVKEWGLLTRRSDRMSLSIVMHAPDRRTRDADNILKPLIDALTHARCWMDDEQIDELTIRRGSVAPPNGYVEVTIERLPEKQPAQKTLIGEDDG